MQDLRFAVRSLLKSPGFAAAAILTLAVGIGASTAMFSILYSVVLDPLGFRDPGRVVRVWETDKHNASFREGASPPDFFDWKAQQRVFASLAGTSNREMNLTDAAGDPERVGVTAVSYDYHALLGVRPIVGRGFVEAEDQPGAAAVAIVAESFWRRRFGSRSVVGREITLDGVSHRIVGVMPQAAALSRQQTDVWIPLAPAIAAYREQRGVHNVFVLGRLREGVTLKQAQSEMSVIAGRLEKKYPADNVGRGVFVEPVLESMIRTVRPRLYVLFAAAVAVLLIACINIAGLLLARADARSRELAIRASLGASRGRLVRQLLTESLAIAVIGGVLGTLLAWWTTKTFIALAPSVPRLQQTGLNVPVLLFALGVSLLSALIFGVIPAMRTSSVRPASALGGRGIARATRTAGRGILVVTEVALAVVVVTAAGLLLKSLSRLMAVDVGLSDTAKVVTFSMKLPEAKYADAPDVVGFYDRTLRRVGELPGISRAAMAMNHPLDSGWTSRIFMPGQLATDGPKDEIRIRAVTPEYFAALGMTMLRGRSFTADDRDGRPPVAVINETLAERYFAGQDPVGKQVGFWGKPRTIVGVVKGERFGGPVSEREPAIYPPLAQLPMSDVTLIVRTHDPATATSNVRTTLRALDRDIALFDVETLDVALSRTVATPRFQAILLASFGAVALALAAIGLYALISYQVQQRTSEIGVRLALGATRAEVARLVLTRASALALTGVAAGLVGAILAGRFLRAILYGISTTDPAIYSTVPLLLVAVALIATWLPARRAMGVDPAVALRWE